MTILNLDPNKLLANGNTDAECRFTQAGFQNSASNVALERFVSCSLKVYYVYFEKTVQRMSPPMIGQWT